MHSPAIGIVIDNLAARHAATRDGELYVYAPEVQQWPAGVLEQLQRMGILVPTTPATSVICPGCEEQCCEPVVDLDPARTPFVACMYRDDVARVSIPRDMLARWRFDAAAYRQWIVNSQRLSIDGEET